MKTLIFLLLMCGVASADMYYLVDKDNKVIAKQTAPTTDYQNQVGGFICVKSKDDIDFSVAEYRGGKIVTHIQTKDEIQAKSKADADAQAQVTAKASAITKLKSLGLTDAEVAGLMK